MFDRARLPASHWGSSFFPGAASVERGKRRSPESISRRHDLRVVETFETQVTFMGVPRGIVEVLQFGVDLGH